MKDKVALQQKTQFKVVAGDNANESKIAATKLQLRRTNSGCPAGSHIDQLCASRLNDSPGLLSVFEAFRVYRQCRANTAGCQPKDFLDVAADKEWLSCLAEAISCVGQDGRDGSVYRGVLSVVGACLRPTGALPELLLFFS